MYRLTPSLLDSFRLYQTADWMALSDLEARIKGEPVTQTPAMKLGSAFHAIAEGVAEVQGNVYYVDGLLFDLMSINPCEC